MGGRFSFRRFLRYVSVTVLVVAAGGYIFLSSYNFSRISSIIIKPVEEVLDREVTVGGEVRLEFGVRPRILLEEVALKNAPWGSRGEMAKMERIELGTRLLPLFLGRLEVTEVVFVKPDILLEKGESGLWNIDAGLLKRLLKWLSEMPELRFEAMEIRDGAFSYRVHGSEKTQRLLLERFRASRTGPEDRIQLDVEARYQGKPFLLMGTVGSLEGIDDPDAKWPLNLSAKYADVSMKISGGIKDLSAFRGLLLDFSVKGDRIERLPRLAGYTVPFGGKFRVSGRLSDPSHRIYNISKLEVELAEGQFAGSAAVDVSKDRPFLTLDVRSERVDLCGFFDALLPTGAVHTRKGHVLPDIAIPTAGLDRLDLKMDLAAREVLTPGPKFLDLRAALNLKDGYLALKPVTARIRRGTFKAGFEIQPTDSEPLIGLSLDIAEVPIRDMLGRWERGNIPEGTISTDIAVAGKGVSTGSVMAGLEGKVHVIMQKGLIKRKWLEGIRRHTNMDISDFFEPQKGQSSHMNVNCLVCAFAVEQGVAASKALFLDTPEMVVAGKGKIDLETERIDFSLNQVSKDGIGVGINGIGSIGLNVSNLAEPLKISGTLENPSLTVDPADAFLTIGKIAGGIVLFGPLGIAAALIDSDLNDIDSCEAAVEASEKGVQIHVEQNEDMFFNDVPPGYDP